MLPELEGAIKQTCSAEDVYYEANYSTFVFTDT